MTGIVVVSGADKKKVSSDYGRLAKILSGAGYRGYIVLEYEEPGEPIAKLRITSVEHASQKILIPALAKLLPDYPDISVEITVDNGLTDIVEDPHLAAIGYFKQVEHPSEGSIRSMAVPSEWSESAPEYRRHAPRLGEHTREVLAEIAGLSDLEIDEDVTENLLQSLERELQRRRFEPAVDRKSVV